jgi:NADPH-dependent curcumin reductase CurA
MVVFDYEDRYQAASAELAQWLRDGKLTSHEHVVGGGVLAFPEVLLKLFAGENTGKLILRARTESETSPDTPMRP